MDDLNRRLFETVHMFPRLQFSVLLPEDISKNDFATLMCIEHGAGGREDSRISISALAKALHVKTPAVSRTLKGLEEKKLVIREVDTKDRRNTFVSLTENGKTVLQQAEKEICDFSTAVIQDMKAEEVERLIDYLQQFYKTAEKELERRKEINKKK